MQNRSHTAQFIWQSLLIPSVVLLYIFFIQPWHMRWGASDQELAMALPGDTFIPAAGVVSTRAITIQAPAAQVWSWLVLIEAIVMLFVYEFSRLLNSHQTPIRTAAIAVLFSGSLAIVGQTFVQRTLGIYFDALVAAGFLFWLGLPYLLFVSATTWMSWRQQIQKVVLSTNGL